ncbi:MAG TPA: hypothetical protein VIW26_12030 [Gemmatimonadales bacterium]|jgi:hypothetical protein
MPTVDPAADLERDEAAKRPSPPADGVTTAQRQACLEVGDPNDMS